jgi:hypothetical protein
VRFSGVWRLSSQGADAVAQTLAPGLKVSGNFRVERTFVIGGEVGFNERSQVAVELYLLEKGASHLAAPFAPRLGGVTEFGIKAPDRGADAVSFILEFTILSTQFTQ